MTKKKSTKKKKSGYEYDKSCEHEHEHYTNIVYKHFLCKNNEITKKEGILSTTTATTTNIIRKEKRKKNNTKKYLKNKILRHTTYRQKIHRKPQEISRKFTQVYQNATGYKPRKTTMATRYATATKT